MMTCEEVRLSLGAHALGALDPEEALEIDNHLATCETCGPELVELEGVASFLGKVSERDVELVASPPRQVLDRLLNDRAKRNRRGRLLLAAAASVAVLAVGGTVWTVVQSGQAQQTSAAAPASARSQEAAPNAAQDSKKTTAELYGETGQPPKTPLPSPRQTARTQQADVGRDFPGENRAAGYYATVSAWPGDDGTELGVRVSGVPVGTTCSLVVVAADGRRDPTESWVITREGYQDKAVFKRTTSLLMSDIARFEIVDQVGKVLVKVPVRK
ncbi:anti-sigma factor family protein [Nonomuraea sp. M3C6]|uniref:Anti-sigma factor family protein n=1 Tax=Nonomuraea marmarensis TaxID=3351344 RepID=A0ABW7AP28_9ACTN